jgi:hypothetical protein
MPEELTTKLSFRLNTAVFNALSMCAADEGYETMAYIQKVLSRRAVESGHMTPDAAAKTGAYEKLFEIAVDRSRLLYKENLFCEDWTLTVFRHLMKDEEFRPAYEATIGGDAYDIGLPGKTPLNMYLGWYIKNAVGAVPKTTSDGKPVRVQVKNEPIQSYTQLLAGLGP